MSAKRKWIVFACLSVLVAAGAGALIYMQRQTLEKNRAKDLPPSNMCQPTHA